MDALHPDTTTPSAPSERGLFYEYTAAANPIRADLTPRIPYQFFPPVLYAEGPSRVVPLDLSTALKCEGPATGPGLCANFIRLLADGQISLTPNATSQVFYVIRGNGTAGIGSTTLNWAAGDFFTVPGGSAMQLAACADAALYYVHDEPLLRYLGVTVSAARFAPAHFTAAQADAELAKVANEPGAHLRNRISVLLAAPEFPLTRTVTHVLWAMYGLIGPNSAQKPHRHQSIALDFIVSCQPGCYSLVGPELDKAGDIRNPVRVDWESGCAFVTPPGYWHAHFNESACEARLIPIQDAGLQTYLRTLDIRFT